MSPRSRISRRRFLSGMGGVALSLPLLEAMCTSAYAGEAGAIPPRFIGILSPNGTLLDQWFPSGDELNFELAPLMEDLVPHRRDLVILRGIDNLVADTGEVDGHREGTVSMLTGWGATLDSRRRYFDVVPDVSLDQRLAAHVGAGTRLPSVGLSAQPMGSHTSLAYGRFGQPLPEYSHPLAFFRAAFGSPSEDGDGLKQLLFKRRSVLDAVLDEFRSLKRQVSGNDSLRLDAHFEAVREVERRLSVQITCGAELPALLSDYPPDSLPSWVNDMMDILVLVMACDITRVVTTCFRSPGGGDSYFPWLGLHDFSSHLEDHHNMTHRMSEWLPELAKIFRWYQLQTALLIKRLKATPELDGSLFDHTLILQGSECSDPSTHGREDIPFLIAGSAGGRLSTGRFLQFDHKPHNDLLVSIAQIFGMNDTCIGNPYFCNGPLPGLL